MPDIPILQPIPIGLNASGTRKEFDSMGGAAVPANRYWGAQTEQSLHHFDIGDDRMPKPVYHAYGFVKKACALVNAAAGRLPEWKRDAIVQAADEAIAGGTRLKEAALASGKVDEALFDKTIHPLDMVGHGRAGA